MKPANFPAKVNSRRERALKRLEDDIKNHPHSGIGHDWRPAIANRLALKLNAGSRAIRTKKDRSSGARFAR